MKREKETLLRKLEKRKRRKESKERAEKNENVIWVGSCKNDSLLKIFPPSLSFSLSRFAIRSLTEYYFENDSALIFWR